MKNTCFVQLNQEVLLFQSVEEVWFWCCKGQLIRESGNRFVKKTSISIRPCSIDDIVRIIVKLKFSGKISQPQVDILYKYGNRFCPPDKYNFEEEKDCSLWENAMNFLEKECLKKNFLEKQSYHE